MKTSTAAIPTARGRPQSKPPFNEKRIRSRNATQTAARGLVQFTLSVVSQNRFPGQCPYSGLFWTWRPFLKPGSPVDYHANWLADGRVYASGNEESTVFTYAVVEEVVVQVK